MLRRVVMVGVASVTLAFGMVGSAWAGQGNPSGTGPPSQTCGSQTAPNPPSSQTASAPGSPFNEESGVAGSKYSPKSQYDVACYQTSNH